MSNGVNVLANALQSYLARKHAGGMMESQQGLQRERDAAGQALQGREWQRDDVRREEDMARALEQQTWSRNWSQEQAAASRADKAADRGIDAAKESAQSAFQREQLQAQKDHWRDSLEAQKTIAKGRDDTRRSVATTPRPGGSGKTGPRRDDTPLKVWQKQADVLKSMYHDASVAYDRKLAAEIRQKIEAHMAIKPNAQPDEEEESDTPAPGAVVPPPAVAAPRGRAGDY